MGLVIKLISVLGLVALILLLLFCIAILSPPPTHIFTYHLYNINNFLSIFLGSGLYIASEWVEENSRKAKRILEVYTLVSLVLLLSFLLIDGAPFLRIVFSVVCLGVYSLFLNTFPLVNIASFTFVASCACALGNHFVWFLYFADNVSEFSVLEIVSFMTICVWLLPILYLISLDSPGNALPSFDSSGKSKKRQKIFSNIFSFFSNDSSPASS
ncbi:Protein SVP26 [Smittium mucronatum]|uniref:Protein SVP26 n=1 Tax=Smittium mucronatum TaxID=133383 RepID=A0A1R0H0K8_9FUNG|nr:Protein SVP26 [Smittium mucronatum]